MNQNTLLLIASISLIHLIALSSDGSSPKKPSMSGSVASTLAPAAGECPPGGAPVNSALEGQAADACAAGAPPIVVVTPLGDPAKQPAINDEPEGYTAASDSAAAVASLASLASASTNAMPAPSAPLADVNSTADKQIYALQKDHKSKSENPKANLAAGAAAKKSNGQSALVRLHGASAAAAAPKVKYLIGASTHAQIAQMNQNGEVALQGVRDLVKGNDCPDAAAVRAQFPDLPCFVVAKFWNCKNSDYFLQIHREGFKLLNGYPKFKKTIKVSFPHLSEIEIDEQAPKFMKANLVAACLRIGSSHGRKCGGEHNTPANVGKCVGSANCFFETYDVPEVMRNHALAQNIQKVQGKEAAEDATEEAELVFLQEGNKSDNCVIS